MLTVPHSAIASSASCEPRSQKVRCSLSCSIWRTSASARPTKCVGLALECVPAQRPRSPGAGSASAAGRKLVVPQAVDLAELVQDVGARRQEQRTLRVAPSELGEVSVDRLDLARGAALALRPARRPAEREPVAVHAQAAGVVDGGGAALELP